MKRSTLVTLQLTEQDEQELRTALGMVAMQYPPAARLLGELGGGATQFVAQPPFQPPVPFVATGGMLPGTAGTPIIPGLTDGSGAQFNPRVLNADPAPNAHPQDATAEQEAMRRMGLAPGETLPHPIVEGSPAAAADAASEAARIAQW